MADARFWRALSGCTKIGISSLGDWRKLSEWPRDGGALEE